MELQKYGLEKFTQLTEQKADSLPSSNNLDLNKLYEAFCSVILSSAKVYIPEVVEKSTPLLGPTKTGSFGTAPRCTRSKPTNHWEKTHLPPGRA